MLHKNKFIILVLVALMLIASACGDDKDKDKDKDEDKATATTEATEAAQPTTEVSTDKPVIKLVKEPWAGSEVNNEVAKYILENEMGYTVEFVDATGATQFPVIASGEAHASLEVWPTGHAEDVQKYIIDEKSIIQGSGLGIEGRVGWFIPTYVARTHPELLTWEGFLDPENAKLFATEETGDKGAFFLAGNWGSFDAEIIQNLSLNMQVVEADFTATDTEGKLLDPEQVLADYVGAAFDEERPIVFYFWSPHWLFNQFDLSEVALPPYSDECYADGVSEIDCAYPVDVLYKMYGAGFPEYAPDAYQLLENISFTNQDQIAMTADMKFNNKTAEAAALTWIEDNEETWRAWIPASE